MQKLKIDHITILFKISIEQFNIKNSTQYNSKYNLDKRVQNNIAYFTSIS